MELNFRSICFVFLSLADAEHCELDTEEMYDERAPEDAREERRSLSDVSHVNHLDEPCELQIASACLLDYYMA